MSMIAGILVGGIVWAACFSVFLVFPNPWSFVLAFFVGPFVGGYSGARLGRVRAAYFLIIVGCITVLALSITYVPDTSWEYPRHVWTGVGVFIALLVLGNVIFVGFGSLTGIRVGGRGRLTATYHETNIRGPANVSMLRGTAPKTPSPLLNKITELEMKEKDLTNDLTVIKDKKGLGQISPELLEQREKMLQSELLDVVLEKERLVRKSKGKG